MERFEALSREGVSALLLASVGLSWRSRSFADQLLPFRRLVEKVSDSLAFLVGRIREGSTLKRGRTGGAQNGELLRFFRACCVLWRAGPPFLASSGCRRRVS